MYCPAHKFSTPNAVQRKQIGIILFNGFMLSELSRLVDAFQPVENAAYDGGRRALPYDLVLLSAAGGRIASATSVFVWTERIDAAQPTSFYHAFFVMSGYGLQSALKDTRLFEWMRGAASNGEQIFATASTRQRLKAAGLHAITAPPAPLSCEPIVSPKHTSVEAQDLVCAARRLIDEEHAEKLAPYEANANAPATKSLPALSAQPFVPHSSSKKIDASIHWFEANFDKPISIRGAAQAAAMSERNFLRHFKAETSLTPSEYVLNLRLNAICRLLIETNLPVDKIARRCGLGSGARLAKLFRNRLRVTPTEYRHTLSTTWDKHAHAMGL